MLKILPYKRNSKSAKTLAERLNVPFAEETSPDDVILNWGNSKPKFDINCRFLNLPISVQTAANKEASLLAFEAAGVPCPEFTNDFEVAQEWLDFGYKVVARYNLHGHSGDGIEIIRPGEYLYDDALLYTKYIKKEKEFRVHVMYGHVIDYTQKKARKEKDENYNPLIRNHANGWVFCRNGIEHHEVVKEVAKKAVAALKLDFGAVDVVYRNGKAWALEVNTAPGIDGLTIDQYVIAMEELRLI